MRLPQRAASQVSAAPERPRPTARRRGYTTKWDTYSQSFLGYNPWCVDPLQRHPSQRVPATVTDHIIAHKLSVALDSGDPRKITEARRLFWDKNNHQAVCAACNSAKAMRFEGGAGKAMPITIPQVVIVFGPPGSGKSHYVETHKAKGDLVWDADAIVGAITGIPGHAAASTTFAVPFTQAMKRAFYSRAMEASDAKCIWIIECQSTPHSMSAEIARLHATVVSMDTPKQTCLERVSKRGSEWVQIVEDWFASH